MVFDHFWDCGFHWLIRQHIIIDAKKTSKDDEPDRWELFTHGGRKETGIDADAIVRICLEKKQRRGKTAVIVRGLKDETDELLNAYSKDLKKLCGVGGSAKGGEIIIQGNQREKIQKYFVDKGYTDVKLAGG